MASVESVLNIARGEIGYSRYNDPEKGSKYGRWYAKMTGESYFGENGVPYCAMFVSWVFAGAGQAAPGLPGSYCPYIVNAGKKAGATVPVRNARAGDIVLFDWGGDGVSDHVGIVENNNGNYLTCIEGNTSAASNSNGGTVARRTRAYSTVISIIRPVYNGDDDIVTPQDKQDIVNMILNAALVSANDGKTYPLSAFLIGTNDAAWKAYGELIRTDDPSGHGSNLKTHDHIKYMADLLSKTYDEVKNVNDRLGKLETEVSELKGE